MGACGSVDAAEGKSLVDKFDERTLDDFRSAFNTFDKDGASSATELETFAMCLPRVRLTDSASNADVAAWPQHPGLQGCALLHKFVERQRLGACASAHPGRRAPRAAPTLRADNRFQMCAAGSHFAFRNSLRPQLDLRPVAAPSLPRVYTAMLTGDVADRVPHATPGRGRRPGAGPHDH